MKFLVRRLAASLPHIRWSRASPVVRRLMGLLVALSFAWPLLMWALPRLTPPSPCLGPGRELDPSALEPDEWKDQALPWCGEKPQPENVAEIATRQASEASAADAR